jgi:hypothetical protein
MTRVAYSAAFIVSALLGLGHAGPAAAVDSPCLEFIVGGPATTCPNCPITLTGTVHNCSLSPETVGVTVNGATAFQELLAAGASASFAYTTISQCTEGTSITYEFIATATTGTLPDAQATKFLTLPCSGVTPARHFTWGALKQIYR